MVFKNLQSPARKMEIPTQETSDGHVELAFLPGLAGPRHGMVQKQVTAQGWLMSTPEGDDQIDADALGARWLSPAGPPAIPLLSLTKIRVLNPA